MGHSVLIVDDEMLIREGLRRHIAWDRLNMEVTGVADSAESALEIALADPPDILITDICMREKSGINLIEDLLDQGISPQTILISSYNDFSYAQAAVRLQVVREYILKPIDTDALEKVLAKIQGDLEQQAETVPQESSELVPAGEYREFLRAIWDRGFNRHTLLQFIRSGREQEALDMWENVASVLREHPGTFPACVRFCVNLQLVLISEGGLTDCSDAEDPVETLRGIANGDELSGYMAKIISGECRKNMSDGMNVQSKLVSSSLELINRSYCDPKFNLTTLAAQLGVTPNYLSIRFKEETGVGFMKYLLDKQMTQAKLLLADPKYKVYEVSVMVGFHDEKFFSRQFKKLVGVTPREYRNQRTRSL